MKPPYYKPRPGETVFRYVVRVCRCLKEMYPYARMHGIRYFFDTRYRRHLSNKRKRLLRMEREYPLHTKGARKQAKALLIIRDGQVCQFCTDCFEPEDLTIDHVFPLFMGGTSDMENLQLLCRPCHGNKCRIDHVRYVKGVELCEEELSSLKSYRRETQVAAS